MPDYLYPAVVAVPTTEAAIGMNKTYQSFYDVGATLPSWFPEAITPGAQGAMVTLVRIGSIVDGSVRDEITLVDRSTSKEFKYTRTMNPNNSAFGPWIMMGIDFDQLFDAVFFKNIYNQTNQDIGLANGSWSSPSLQYLQPDGTTICGRTVNGQFIVDHNINGNYFSADVNKISGKEFHTSTGNLKYGNYSQVNLYAGSASQWYTLIDVPATNQPWAIEGYLSVPGQHFLARIRFAGSVRSIGPTMDMEILGCYSYWNYYPSHWRVRVEPANGRCSLDFRFVGTLAANVSVRFDTVSKLIVGAEASVKLAAAGTWSGAASAGVEILTATDGLKWRKAFHQIGYGNFTLLSPTGAWSTLAEASSYGV